MVLSQKFPLCFCVFVITICSQKSYSEAAGYKKDPFLRMNKDFNATKRLPLMGEATINYGNLEISEPGFDITDEEIKKLKIWPLGVIPYFIDDFSFDKVLRDRLRAFLEHTNTVSGVRFSELSQPPDDDSRWVFFINRRGVLPCADLDIRQFNSTGVQRVVIGYDCMEPANLAEMALVLVGVPPQHNAPNRDKYVEVQEGNILPDKKHLFEKLSDSEWLFHDVEYDFTSVGHYGYHKYTANGGATLKPVKVVDVRAGEVTSFSYNDIWKMRMLYNYISRKGRKGKANVGACSKLFKPGAKFRDFTPDEDSEDELNPRPKPSKYTGIPEESLPQPEDDQDDNDNNETSYKNEEENLEDGNSGAEESGLKNKLKDKKPSKKKPKKKKVLELSDIQTDE